MFPLVPGKMKQVDITKNTYGERVEKKPPFAKDIMITLSDDVSVEVMKVFREEKSDKWVNPMLKEIIVDWNLTDEKNEKLPIGVEGLDKIKSLKLRNWIIETVRDFIIERVGITKKKELKEEKELKN